MIIQNRTHQQRRLQSISPLPIFHLLVVVILLISAQWIRSSHAWMGAYDPLPYGRARQMFDYLSFEPSNSSTSSAVTAFPRRVRFVTSPEPEELAATFDRLYTAGRFPDKPRDFFEAEIRIKFMADCSKEEEESQLLEMIRKWEEFDLLSIHATSTADSDGLVSQQQRISSLWNLKLDLTDIPNKGDAVQPDVGALSELRTLPFDLKSRIRGGDWPLYGATMVGLLRLNNFQRLIETVVTENVVGDILEAGVWRGGACVLAKRVVDSLGSDRRVWVADSFAGLPPASTDLDTSYFALQQYVAVSLDEVQSIFTKYKAMDDAVVFVKGFFNETMPQIRKRLIDDNRRLSILRLDADMYESTVDILYHLYDLLSVGGYVIVDDYNLFMSKDTGMKVAPDAVREFRRIHKIGVGPEFSQKEHLVPIDGAGVYWRKLQDAPLNRTSYDAFNERRTFVGAPRNQQELQDEIMERQERRKAAEPEQQVPAPLVNSKLKNSGRVSVEKAKDKKTTQSMSRSESPQAKPSPLPVKDEL